MAPAINYFRPGQLKDWDTFKLHQDGADILNDTVEDIGARGFTRYREGEVFVYHSRQKRLNREGFAYLERESQGTNLLIPTDLDLFESALDKYGNEIRPANTTQRSRR